MKKYKGRRYRRHEKRRTGRRRRMVSGITTLVVLAGFALIAYALLGQGSPLPKGTMTGGGGGEEESAATGPSDTTLWLTVPKMSRVEELPVYDTAWDDESALEKSAQHLRDTGFPWQEEANTYIAGHRMGYPGTDSFLVFYDLDILEDGDEVILEDASGVVYTYEVYANYIADPYDWTPTELVPGRNIVTLQTCTLPDYSERLVVQAELVSTDSSNADESASDESSDTGSSPDDEVEQETPEAEPVPAEPVVPEPIPTEPVVPEPVPVEPVPPEPVPVDPVPAEPVPAEPVLAAPEGPPPEAS